LGLTLIAVMLRELSVYETGFAATRLTHLIERLGRVPQYHEQIDETSRWPRWAAITVVLTLDAVIVASHQLTPYMLLAATALLMLVGGIRPWWMLAAMASMTFAYFAANFTWIADHFPIFSSIDPFNNVHVARSTGQAPDAGKRFQTHVELLQVTILGLASLCACGRLLTRGLLVRSLPLVLLAISPLFVVFGQNYGGEASLRIILFASPWCAALIAWALSTVSRPALRWALTASVAATFTGLFVPSFFGEEGLNIVSPGELRASEWFYSHARHGSVLVLADGNFPLRYGAAYPDFKGPEGDAYPDLLSLRALRNRRLGAADIPIIVSSIRRYGKYGYVAFTHGQIAYAQIYRLTPSGALEHLEAAVARSPEFRLRYGNHDARIYEFVGKA
jgi:hypothetical protein